MNRYQTKTKLHYKSGHTTTVTVEVFSFDKDNARYKAFDQHSDHAAERGYTIDSIDVEYVGEVK